MSEATRHGFTVGQLLRQISSRRIGRVTRFELTPDFPLVYLKTSPRHTVQCQPADLEVVEEDSD